MEKKEKELDELLADGKAYLDRRLELVQLQAVEKGSKLFASLVSNTLLALFFLLAFLLGTIALALFLSTIFSSYTLGFASVALFYLVLAIILLLSKGKTLEKYLINTFVRKYFEKSADTENEN